MLGAWLPAACIVLYIEFYCLHGQMVDVTAFIKLPRNLNCADLYSDDDDVAPFADKDKIEWMLKFNADIWVKKILNAVSYSIVLTFVKPRKIEIINDLFPDFLSLVVQTQSLCGSRQDFISLHICSALFFVCFSFVFFLLTEQYIIWSLAFRGDCSTQYAI